LAALGRIHAGRPERSCAIGSVKTNVGHLDAAAGIAGFLKTVLCLRHGQIPPSLHFSKPNPRIDFEKSPFHVNTELTKWPPPDQSPRRAGVSSFGIGGTNVHVILEEVPDKGKESDTRTCLPYVISARSPETLEEVRTRLSQYLVENPRVHRGDLAFTLARGRHPFAERSFVTARTPGELLLALEDPSELQSAECPSIDRPVVFMFPGQGTQYAGMGRGLYETEAVFREQLDLCAGILTPLIEQDLRDALFPGDANSDQAEEELRQTRLTQPALFAVEYSLAQLWMSWGVQPTAMIGHSIGEYVAACLAGVVSLEDALRIVSARGSLMQQLPRGSMLAVPMTEEELAPHLEGELDLAVQNAPKALIVSGADAAIQELQDRLEKRQVPSRPLRTSHAFHSHMMEPILDPFTRTFSEIDLHPPRIPFVSNLTGEWITAAQATDPSYWAKHLRSTVRFCDGLSFLLKQAHYTLLEIGPGGTLNGLARANPARKAEQPSFASLDRERQKQADQEFLLNTLGDLWLAGVPIDWAGFFAREHRCRIPLPTYPFQRNRYWIDPPSPSAGVGTELLRRPLNQWFWCPTWKQLRHGGAPRDLYNTCWLVFLDEFGLGERIAGRLESAGARVTTITAGDRFEQLGASRFTMKPGEAAGYQDLVVALRNQDFSPSDVLHLWPLQIHHGKCLPNVDAILNRGFYSLVHLVRALGAEAPSARPRIHNATTNLFSVLGEPSGSAVSSTVLGPVEVIPKEYIGFKCRNIDLAMLPEEPPGLVEALWNECSLGNDESVALRGGYRWVRVFDRVDLDATTKTPARIRQRSTYLVTGGLGGLGFVLSRHLAQTAQANLVLVGRTRLPDSGAAELTDSDRSKLDRLQELRACGTHVDYYAADIADLEQMKNAVQRAEEKHGSIQGVIHAAGVAGGGVIQQKDLDDCTGVLEPKVKGALVLEEIFRTRAIDFLLLCSSTTALLGEFGQVDYAAANIFLDSFASRDETAMPWTCSVNWDTWKEIGMAAETDVPATLQEARSRLLGTGITSAEGIQVFDRIMASDLSQVVVSTRDFQSRMEREADSSPDALAIVSEAAPSHERPDLSSRFQTPETPTEKAVANIWERFLGIRGIGADDDFFELGGHSLLATQVISRIREEFEVDLPMPSFFNQPTLAGMADNIDTICWASQQKSATAPGGHEPREKFEL
jgi:acyl transferase domain-containing protein/acyl carrier protein